MNDRQRFGAIVLSILLIAAGGFTALSAAKGATDGMNGDDSDDGEMSGGDSVFSEPVMLSFAGITIEVGPPVDNDGDGVYEDLNGDGELTVLDAVLHFVVVTAVDEGQLELTNDQADAVDVDRDGDVDYDDATELARMALMADGGDEEEADDSEEMTTEAEDTTTETPEETTEEETTTEEATDTATPTPDDSDETTTEASSDDSGSSVNDGPGDDLNCEDFDSVEDAQENADSTDDENNLDGDGDGEACESGVDG